MYSPQSLAVSHNATPWVISLHAAIWTLWINFALFNKFHRCSWHFLQGSYSFAAIVLPFYVIPPSWFSSLPAVCFIHSRNPSFQLWEDMSIIWSSLGVLDLVTLVFLQVTFLIQFLSTTCWKCFLTDWACALLIPTREGSTLPVCTVLSVSPGMPLRLRSHVAWQ